MNCSVSVHRCIVFSMRKEMVRLFLLLSVYLSGVHSLAAGRDLWQGYAGRGLRKSPSRPVVELPESLKARLLRTGTSFDLSLLHRERRGAKCGLLNDAVLEHSPVSECVCTRWILNTTACYSLSL